MTKIFKGLGLVLMALVLVVGVGADSAGATLTFDATSVVSNGALTVNGAAAGAIVIGNTGQTSAITIGDTASSTVAEISIGGGNGIKTAINIGDGSGANGIAIGGAASNIVLTDAQWGVTGPGVATFVNALVTPHADTGLDVSSAGALSIGNTTATSVSICNDSPNCDSVLIATDSDGGTITIGNVANSAVSIFDDNWSVTTGGVATFASVNKLTITAPATSATLTIVDGGSLITAGAFAITLTSTATTNATLPAGTSTLYGTGADTITSAALLSSITNETGTGVAVFSTSPTLVTPVLGVATGTSFQGIIGNVTPAAGTFTTLAGTTSLAIGSGTAITKVEKATTAAIDLGALVAAGCSVATSNVIADAALGDTVKVSPLLDDAAWDTGSLTAFVESAGIIKITYCAPASGDPGSMTYNLALTKF